MSLWFFDLVFWNQVWGRSVRSSFPSSLHVPDLILCFGISLVEWIYALSPHVFFLGFDLVFWNQFSVGSDLRSLSFSSLARVPWGFDLVFWKSV
jgi:hypothetical protein